jgi:hypothetical protein
MTFEWGTPRALNDQRTRLELRTTQEARTGDPCVGRPSAGPPAGEDIRRDDGSVFVRRRCVSAPLAERLIWSEEVRVS